MMLSMVPMNVFGAEVTHGPQVFHGTGVGVTGNLVDTSANGAPFQPGPGTSVPVNSASGQTYVSNVTITVPFSLLNNSSLPVQIGGGTVYRAVLSVSFLDAAVFPSDVRRSDLVNRNDDLVFPAGSVFSEAGFGGANHFQGERGLVARIGGANPTFELTPSIGNTVNQQIGLLPVERIGTYNVDTGAVTLNPRVQLGFDMGHFHANSVVRGSVWGRRIVHAGSPNATVYTNNSAAQTSIRNDALTAVQAIPGHAAATLSPAALLPEPSISLLAAPGGTARAYLRTAEIDSSGNGVASIVVETATRIFSDAQGTISIDIPVRGQRDNDRWQNSVMSVGTSAYGTGANFAQIISNYRLPGAALNNVSWSVTGGARGFSSTLAVPPLRISEGQFRALSNPNGDMHIRLEAPQFYTWSFAPATGVQVTQDIIFGRTGIHAPLEIAAGGASNGRTFEGANVTSRPIVGDSEFIVRYGSASAGVGRGIWGNRTSPDGAAPHALGLHRIYIPIDSFTRNPAWGAHGTGWLEVRNLWLVPDENAASTGDVSIGVQIGRFPLGGQGGGVAVGGAPSISWAAYAVEHGQSAPSTTVAGALTPGQVNNTGATIVVTIQTTNAQIVGATGDVNWLGAPVLQPGQRTTLHVGTRGASALTVEVHDGPRDMRTGHLGQFRAANADAPNMPDNTGGLRGQLPQGRTAWLRNRDNEGTPFNEGVMTSTLIIEENIPGGFSTGFGSAINFEFLDDDGSVHPGIRILGMEARAGNFRTSDWQRGELNNFWGGFEGIAGPGSVLPGGYIPNNSGAAAPWRNSNQNWMTFRGWVSALDQRMPNAPNVGRISDLGATLYLPTQNISEVSPNVPNHHNNGILEVRFWLSIEAGFEWKYGSNIDVTISGAGVSNLGTYVATVGHARDAVQMNLTEGVTAVETGTLYNIVGGVQPISDVVINVDNNEAFAIGEELWIYVGTDTIGRNFDINLVNIPTVTVENADVSGLRLDSGRLMAPTAGGHLGRAGVAFTVARQPYGGDAPAPVITISNLNVEGQAFPGVEYQIIVSGTGIANNDQEVFNALRLANRPHITQPAPIAGLAQAAAVSPMNRGVFTSLPFNETVLENVFGGVWDTAPEPAPLPPAVVGPVEHRLWAGMGPIAGVDDPFRWVDTPGTNLRVGFLSARAFGYIINGSPDVGVEWNEATNTATITGEDINGNSVSVVMTVGSNIAQINGVPTDIAAFAGASGPDGSIQVVPTPDGRIFLPIRFLTNAFGRTVTGEGEVVVIR